MDDCRFVPTSVWESDHYNRRGKLCKKRSFMLAAIFGGKINNGIIISLALWNCLGFGEGGNLITSVASGYVNDGYGWHCWWNWIKNLILNKKFWCSSCGWLFCVDTNATLWTYNVEF